MLSSDKQPPDFWHHQTHDQRHNDEIYYDFHFPHQKVLLNWGLLVNMGYHLCQTRDEHVLRPTQQTFVKSLIYIGVKE